MKTFSKTVSLLFIVLLLSQTCRADIVDSLLQVLKTQNADTNKVKTLIDIGWEYSYTDIKQTESYALQALLLSEKLSFNEGKAQAYNLIGVVHRTTSNYDKAIDYFQKALQMRIQLNQVDKQAKIHVNIANVYLDMADYAKATHYYNIAIDQAKQIKSLNTELMALTNLSVVYQNISDYSKSLDCLFKALQINKQIKDEIQTASVYSNIALVYMDQNQYDLAIEYNSKALEIYKRNKRDDMLAVIHNNLGIIYRMLDKYTLSLENYNESLSLYKKIGADVTADMLMQNIGIVYFDMKQYDKSLEFQNIALNAAVKNGDEYHIARCMLSIADVYNAQGNYKKAEEYALKGLSLTKKQEEKNEIKAAYQTLSNIYSSSKNFEKAFQSQERILELTIFLNNDAINERIGQMQAMYQADKKQKEIELLTKDKEIQNERIGRQNIVNYAVSAGLILVLVFAFISYKRYREKKKANVEITTQKEIIEVKNKEILDSIYYARRIQRALLASDQLLTKKLPEYFILYKPKDIVSGDFYWAAEIESGNKFLLATCDCTGHGVPGAFMSLLNISKLNETVIEKKIVRPDLILNQVREEIIKALNPDKTELENGLSSEALAKDGLPSEALTKDGLPSEALAKDGMDAILCSLDFNNNKLHFAAANNSVIIIRNKEILEYKGDKFPVGVHHGELKPFTLQTIDLQKGDCVYTITDGYADQFGGDKGKKLMSKKLKETLSAIADKPMEIQKKELDQIFEKWRGQIEQVDDVLIIGIRV